LTKIPVYVILVTQLHNRYSMFESIEIRKAANGFILVITTEDETKEYVYDTSRKALRVIKEHLEFGNTKPQ
jgi:hypothetical protein